MIDAERAAAAPDCQFVDVLGGICVNKLAIRDTRGTARVNKLAIRDIARVTQEEAWCCAAASGLDALIQTAF